MLDVLLGKKLGMTQLHDEAGSVHPVTVIQLGPCTVMQVKTEEKDGYDALQLGFEDKPRRRATRAERGRAEAAETEPKRFVREVPLSEPGGEQKPGAVLTVNEFEGVSVVDVQGISKGKGFAGVVKRWGFHGSPASHGANKIHRHAGSIGPGTSPGHVVKGLKMGGRAGGAKTTVKNLRVVKVDPERNLLMVEGSVPGPAGVFLSVRVVKRETQK